MSKFCLKCGAENKDEAQFCAKCGYEWNTQTKAQNHKNGIIDKLFYKIDKKTMQRRVSKGKTILMIMIILFILLIIIGSMSPSTPQTNPKITDLSIQSEGYGAYSVSGTLTPDKDYDYLEMVVVFYDDSGAVIDKSPLVWNMNDIQKDQIVKINGNAYVNGDSTPSKAEVYILDSAFGGNDLSDAIYNQTITI